MGFENLVPQTRINPDADRYGERCLERSRAVATTMSCAMDVEYGPEPEHRLDVWMPGGAGPSGGAPVLVFFHGGGFTHGYKEWCGFMAPALAPSLLVAVRYRLMPGVAYPAPMLDAVAAVAWLRSHIATYGGDPDRLVVGGHSAGGAIAACLRTRPDWLAAHGLGPEAIAGAACLSTTFHAFAVSGTAGGAYALAAGPLPLDPESPLARVPAATGPFFIAWGGRERQRERVERSSMALITALRDRGQQADWIFQEDADHFGTHLALADIRHPLSAALRAWLIRVTTRR